MRQRRQNEAFLKALHRTGNARLSAREAGVKYGTIQHRRAGHPDFASRWDIALVDAHARFHAAGGKTGPAMPREAGSALRTEGGELMVVRTKSGRLQVRPACRGKLTRAAEQLFLQALSATANIRLSAAAAGASFAAFYRRQKQKPAFAREMRRALEMGYVRLECAAWVAAAPASHEDDAWFDAEPPPMPQMSVAQALQLLFLHQKKVRLGWEAPHRGRRRGESEEVYLARLRAIAAVEEAREAEDDAVRWALRAGEGAPPPELPPVPELPELPPLDQVTGWSKASGKAPYHPEVALFRGVADWGYAAKVVLSWGQEEGRLGLPASLPRSGGEGDQRSWWRGRGTGRRRLVLEPLILGRLPLHHTACGPPPHLAMGRQRGGRRP